MQGTCPWKMSQWTTIQPSPSVSPPALLAVASSRLSAELEDAASERDTSEVSRDAPLGLGNALVSTTGVFSSSGDASLLACASGTSVCTSAWCPAAFVAKEQKK
ncbi:hypothetical protein WJX77_007784 [Trebouxia sp. C0004]